MKIFTLEPKATENIIKLNEPAEYFEYLLRYEMVTAKQAENQKDKVLYYFDKNGKYECKIIGYIPYPIGEENTCVIIVCDYAELDFYIHKVSPHYLADMQKKGFKLNQTEPEEEFENETLF